MADSGDGRVAPVEVGRERQFKLKWGREEKVEMGRFADDQ